MRLSGAAHDHGPVCWALMSGLAVAQPGSGCGHWWWHWWMSHANSTQPRASRKWAQLNFAHSLFCPDLSKGPNPLIPFSRDVNTFSSTGSDEDSQALSFHQGWFQKSFWDAWLADPNSKVFCSCCQCFISCHYCYFSLSETAQLCFLPF